MNVFEAIHGRRSVRRFKPDPVPPEMLYRIIDAARWAPSAGNLQSGEFVVVQDPNVKKQLAQCALGQKFIEEAPVIIVVCSDTQRSAIKYGERGKSIYSVQETAAAAQNIMLAAYGLKLSTCWVGAFFEEKVSEVLGLPAGVVPFAIIPLGHSDVEPGAPPRADLSDIVHFDKYGNKKVLATGTPSGPQVVEQKAKTGKPIGISDFFA